MNMEIVFVPEYGFKYCKIIIFSIIMIIVGILILIFNKLNDIELFFCGLTFILVFSFLIFNGFYRVIYKKIIFNRRVILERYFFKSISIEYKDINLIGINSVGTNNKGLISLQMNNKTELIRILNSFNEQGIIQLRPISYEKVNNSIKTLSIRWMSIFVGLGIYVILAVITKSEFIIKYQSIFLIAIVFICLGIVNLYFYIKRK